MDKVDQAYLDELLSEGKDDGKSDKMATVSNTTYDEIKVMAKGMGRGNRDHDMDVVTRFIEVSLLLNNTNLLLMLFESSLLSYL